MRKNWFKPVGLVYYPLSPMGWIITLITIYLCVYFFNVVDHRSHSVSDTLIGVFPFDALLIIIAG